MATCLATLRRLTVAPLCNHVHQSYLQTAVLTTNTQVTQAQPALSQVTPPEASNSYPLVDLDLDSAAKGFQVKTTSQLLQSLVVLKGCQFKPLVLNAERLLNTATSIVGKKTTNAVVKRTVFKHFCAGTCAESIQPTLAYLRQNGINGILNYAAESDVTEPNEEGAGSVDLSEERSLDCNLRLFMRSVHDADNSHAHGFVGVKVTALGPPNLLERMSQELVSIGGTLDRGHSSSHLREAMKSVLSADEMFAFDNLMRRLHTLADAVYKKGNMRMLVDAEHTYMQPAIDALAIALQQTYNHGEPVIMGTYQCYLKDAAERLEIDLARASREGWTWGAKTVRGAYMHVERARAAEMGYDSPIQDNLEATNANYNSCVEQIMPIVADGEEELMVASHNQESVDRAVTLMQRHGIRPRHPASGIYFGQLLGMADNLSFPLGREGFNIYKIVPYGPVDATIAYLIRRALENSDVLGGCAKEIRMIQGELARRLNPARALGGLFGVGQTTSIAAAPQHA